MLDLVAAGLQLLSLWWVKADLGPAKLNAISCMKSPQSGLSRERATEHPTSSPGSSRGVPEPRLAPGMTFTFKLPGTDRFKTRVPFYHYTQNEPRCQIDWFAWIACALLTLRLNKICSSAGNSIRRVLRTFVSNQHGVFKKTRQTAR